jgi:hypothetical protein
MPFQSYSEAPDRLKGLGAAVRRTFRPFSATEKERLLKPASEVLVKHLKIELNQPGSGRVYPSATGRGTHQASAPGEPPAPDRGDLRKSVHDRVGNAPGTRHAVVGPHEAAATLQFGSRSRNLLPRPYMEEALKRAKPEMHAAVVATMKVPKPR